MQEAIPPQQLSPEQELGPEYMTRQDLENVLHYTQFQEDDFGMNLEETQPVRQRVLELADSLAGAELGARLDDNAEVDPDGYGVFAQRVDGMSKDVTLLRYLTRNGADELTVKDQRFIRRLVSNLDEATVDPRGFRERYAELERRADEAFEARHPVRSAAEAPHAKPERLDDAEEKEQQAEMLRQARARLNEIHVSYSLTGHDRAARQQEREQASEYGDLGEELRQTVDRIKAGSLTRDQEQRLKNEKGALVPAIHAGDEDARTRYYALRDQLRQGDYSTRNPAELYKVMGALGFDRAEIGQIAGMVDEDAAKHPDRPAEISISFNRSNTGQLQRGMVGFSR